MTVREAECRGGNLRAICHGEPARVSICHCLNCKRRSGSAFTYKATFASDHIQTSGEPAIFSRTSEDGYWSRDAFCPACGSIVWYGIERRPGMITVPVGAFADPDFPEPTVSVYAERRHEWLTVKTEKPIQET